MKKVLVLWHEPSNFLAVADCESGYLPKLTILDDEFEGINPYYSYPLSFLSHYGWIEIGEL